MKTVILVDSACSLPHALRKKYGVSVVPLSYSVDEDKFVDECTELNALDMFESGSFARKYEVHTLPPAPEAFEDAIIKKVRQGYTRIIVQTINRTQGETYNNATSGMVRARKQLDGKEDIILRVMDSRTVFAGQGLMATETIRRLIRNKDEAVVRREMDVLSEKIHTFILPKEPLVALERSRERNESSVGWAQALMASKLGIHPIVCNANDSSHAVAKIWGFKKAAQALFKHISNCIDEGLLCPLITINYCGSLKELRAFPGYEKLEEKAKDNKLMLVPSVGSIASGIYTSVGSLSIAIATDNNEWT